MNLQLDENAVKEAFRAGVIRVLTTEQGLAADAQREVDHLIDELMPLVLQQTQALAASPDPTIASGYLKVLQGVVQASIAKLGLRAIAAHRKLIADLIASGVQILLAALKTASIAL